MDKLYYICQWGNNRKLAWSGTYLKLYESLNKHFELVDVPIKQSGFTKIKNTLMRRDLVKYDFAYSAMKNAGRKAIESIKDNEYCTFQFAELPIRPGAHSYIYIDMCAQFINDVIMKKPSFRDHYFRKKVNLRVLRKRCIMQKQFFNGCAGIFTMSEWLAKYVSETLGVDPKRVHCVGAGADIDINKISPNRSGNKILFVGKSFRVKGGYLVIEAFKILKARYMENAELYIIGPSTNPLSEEVPGIHYKGRLPVEQLSEYYNMCDIFCMPSYIDAYGKVFTEALCSGLPCIGRNILSMNEIIEDGINGYNISCDDVDYLAERMYMLLNDRKIQKYVEDHISEYQVKYSWDSVAARIRDVIYKDDFMR